MGKWKTLEVIEWACAIAGLFHDFGKATVLFQEKLDPQKKKPVEFYRHEWVSVKLFQAFTRNREDKDWLQDLVDQKEISFDCIKEKDENPLKELPPFAKLIAWLILSHHKLPKYPDSWEGDFNNNPAFEDIDRWLENFTAVWNSPKSAKENKSDENNWKITRKGLPSSCNKWKEKAHSLAKQVLASDLLKKERDWLCGEVFTSHISRMALMLADHHFSSLTYDETKDLGLKNNDYQLYANTYYGEDGKKKYKQQLDEHLIGVADNAEQIAKKLPGFIKDLESLPKNKLLEEDISKMLREKFGWQDDAKSMAKKIADNTLKNGFFGINMASTGCGKTIANAKVMYALGKETGKTRFNVALGLRTLTLQTGREFQESLGLKDNELSIAVGGIAVKALFENQQDKKEDSEKKTGSESENDHLNPDLQLSYLGEIKEHALSQWTKGKERTEKLIQPPVLVCTIDHFIPATEGTKRGHQIAPMLRLLSSDLILDEPDDFGLDDLPALCRLVHWSAMLGRRVLLSTATMPPAFVYACFEAYKAGWDEYAKANLTDWNGKIQCAWFDERSDSEEGLFDDFKDFKVKHKHFVSNRVNFLEQQPPKRIGKIVDVMEDKQNTVYENMAKTIYQSINKLHQHHHTSKKSQIVSIGLVRMANIDPMIAVAKELMARNAPENTCIHYCVYHSRFPLAVRSYIEEKLDFILKRKDPDRIWDTEKGVGSIIAGSDKKNHIFVVLASPVAEVGRDHDYDWAVVEPSSMRSLIQLAGRVLRHRNIYPKTANIHLLNKNIKGLKGKEICFEKPGFESKSLKTTTHQLKELMTKREYECINANLRIELPKGFASRVESGIDNLNVLEHKALFLTLLMGNEPANAWWTSKNHWTGEIQSQQRFRKSKKDESYYLYYESKYSTPIFKWFDVKEKKNDNRYKPANVIGTSFYFLYEDKDSKGEGIYYWFDLNPLAIYQKLSDDFDIDISETSKRFGEVKLIGWDEVNNYQYHAQLGILR